MNYTYDAANRPSTATDGSNGITYATDWQSGVPSGCAASAACYTPQGSFYGLSLGQTSGFTGLNITNLYNTRLQPQEFKALSAAGSAIDITYNYVDPVKGGNAGHVFSITNNLNSSRTQSFTYDQVNRIISAGISATSGANCWGYQFTYDGAWGNLTSQAGWTPTYNACTQTNMNTVTADGNNHISSFGYDASGNASGDGTYTYTWDAESQLKSAAGINYLYDGDGRRAAKVGSKLYWYGARSDILAETDAYGNTAAEYVFFGGKRIAMLPGNSAPNAGFEQGSLDWSVGTGISIITDLTKAHTGSNYAQGSTATSAFLDSTQYIPVVPGQQITFGGWGYRESGASGSVTWALAIYDANKNPLSYLTPSPSNVSSAAWTLQQGSVTIQAGAAYALLYAQVYQASRQTVARFDDGFVGFGGGGGSGNLLYVEDQLGTSRVITGSSGAVCYDADFTPYGGERPYTNSCPQNYKFESKERDTETGNDDFGARYYSNRFGRWLTADWSAVPVAVPYANLTNPQTLNLYSMVADDPESFADLDGHICATGTINCESDITSQEQNNTAAHTLTVMQTDTTTITRDDGSKIETVTKTVVTVSTDKANPGSFTAKEFSTTTAIAADGTRTQVGGSVDTIFGDRISNAAATNRLGGDAIKSYQNKAMPSQAELFNREVRNDKSGLARAGLELGALAVPIAHAYELGKAIVDVALGVADLAYGIHEARNPD